MTPGSGGSSARIHLQDLSRKTWGLLYRPQKLFSFFINKEYEQRFFFLNELADNRFCFNIYNLMYSYYLASIIIIIKRTIKTRHSLLIRILKRIMILTNTDIKVTEENTPTGMLDRTIFIKLRRIRFSKALLNIITWKIQTFTSVK